MNNDIIIRQIEALRDEAARRQNEGDFGHFDLSYWQGKRDAYDNVLHTLRAAR